MLIPVGKTAMFSCTAYCNHTCTGVWIIDGLFPQGSTLDLLISQGFNFSTDGQWNGSEYTITLLVNALKTTNNTDIQCEYSSDGYTFHNTTSNPAELLVIPRKLTERSQYCYTLFKGYNANYNRTTCIPKPQA